MRGSIKQCMTIAYNQLFYQAHGSLGACRVALNRAPHQPLMKKIRAWRYNPLELAAFWAVTCLLGLWIALDDD